MKQQDRHLIIEKLKLLHTDKLIEIKNKFVDWNNIHERKINSWFWSGNGNRNQRASKERYYGRDDTVKIAAITIGYISNCRMTRNNVYWADKLFILGSESENINFGDIKKIVNSIDIILERRKK